MKVLVTGAAGRIGRAIYIKLMRHFSVSGIDVSPASTVDFIGSVADIKFLETIQQDVDIVVHAAALHAPHVGIKTNREFVAINVKATKQIAEWGLSRGMKQMVFISSTAVYGDASTLEGQCNWITEDTVPQPRTIYHSTKLKAEEWLKGFCDNADIPVSVLRMSRCFPETADKMAVYRLHRGVDMRDVALACLKTIETKLPGFEIFNISGSTPFVIEDCNVLFANPSRVINQKVPELVRLFGERGWHLPGSIDRVYDSNKAANLLNWRTLHGYRAVFDWLDNEVSEVLPVVSRKRFRGIVEE